MYYVFICEDTENSLEKRRSVRPAHIERIKALEAAGRLLVAGPSMQHDDENPITGKVNGSIIIAKFDCIADAKEWIAADPFVTAEVYGRITVKPFKISLPEDLS